MSASDHLGDNIQHVISNCVVHQLPSIALEHIFSFLRPYKDFDVCKDVCDEWASAIERSKRRVSNLFIRSLTTMRISWESYESKRTRFNISRRYLHSAVYYDNYMYVFGGFGYEQDNMNDLWKFDLSTRTWQQLLVNGQAPPGRGFAVMVAYNNKLILFAGLTSWSADGSLNRDLYVYDIPSNRWSEKNSRLPENIYSHVATVHGDKMVVIGETSFNGKGNDIFVLDLVTYKWKTAVLKETSPVPICRFSFVQIAIDDKHLLMIGNISMIISNLLKLK